MEEAFALAKKTYEASASILDQAKRLVQHSESSLEKAKELTKESQSTVKAIKEKVSAISKLNERFHLSNQQKRNDLKELRHKLRVFVEVDDLFGKLQSSNVDPWITGENESQTLYDYVDSEAVIALKQNVQKSVDELEDLLNLLDQNFSDRKNSFLQLAKNTLSMGQIKEEVLSGVLWDNSEIHLPQQSTTSQLDLIRTMKQKQEGALDDISVISMRAATSYDQLLKAKDKLDTGTPFTMEELSKEKITILSYGKELNEKLRKIANSTQAINTAMRELEKKKDELVKLESGLKNHEKLGELVYNNEESVQFERLKADTAKSIGELQELANFFSKCLEAKETLKPEIDRRWNAIAEIENLAKLQQEELNKLVEAEINARKEYFNEHGVYLPESLCPAISPELLPTSFQYVVANPEDAELLHDSITRQTLS